MTLYPKFEHVKLDAICRELAGAATHKEVSLLLKDARLDDVGGQPKWERMLLALTARQDRDGCSNAILNFISKILHPQRFAGKGESFAAHREAINYQLAFIGIFLDETGVLKAVSKANTMGEAEQRASELQSELRRRNVHYEVLSFCRPELLDFNYFHCVLEASKSLAHKIREKTGLTGDGAEIVDAAFSLKTPLLALNSLQTKGERDEQAGFSNLLKGIFGTFRNVTAHEPKKTWMIDKQEALDALTIISFSYRKLDEAVVVPKITGGSVS